MVEGPLVTPMVWHLLQLSDVLDLEFASALAETLPILAWKPQRVLLPGLIRAGDESEDLTYLSPGFQASTTSATPIRTRRLPLMRGFARPPVSLIARTGPDVLARLLRQTSEPANSPLICTVPFFADVAECWPGPVVYWLTDLIAEYSSADRKRVIQLDRRMCRAATLICPNSRRLSKYLVEQADCEPGKIQIVPNATRASNVYAAAPSERGPRPAGMESVQKPIVGVIGNLAGNMDWLLLERVVQLTPEFSWVFVGPTSMHIVDPAARRARAAIMQVPNARFLGAQPYGALAAFARSFDVAMLPYLRCEPTYSGSSTRFYEHLAACRPMVSTRGLEELTHKEPLLTLVDTSEEAAAALEALRARDFDDGLTTLRWQASRNATWQCRAASVQQALRQRLTPEQAELTLPQKGQVLTSKSA
jgi:hypothetical protein